MFLGQSNPFPEVCETGVGTQTVPARITVEPNQPMAAALDLVHVRSAHCDISLVEAAKHGFEDVITLQASVGPATSPEMAGTDFKLEGVSTADIKAAKDFFLRFSGDRVLENTPYGQVLERAGGCAARIYVTGLLVAQEERFAFSYNVTSLTAAIRKALNRERTNVGRTAYADRVKSMLLASQSEQVAQVLASDLSNIETWNEP